MTDAGKGDDRLVFDCLSAILLLLVAVLGAYMPKYLARKGSLQQGTASSLAFHLGNMLSGGVMLSAGFCHLLADALRQLAFVGRFPIAPFLAAVGYLLTLLADQVVQLLTTDVNDPQRSHVASLHHGPSAEQGPGRQGSGFQPAAAVAAVGKGLSLWQGSNSKWGYSRLEDMQLRQQENTCQATDIELMGSSLQGGTSSSNNNNSSGECTAAGPGVGTGVPPCITAQPLGACHTGSYGGYACSSVPEAGCAIAAAAGAGLLCSHSHTCCHGCVHHSAAEPYGSGLQGLGSSTPCTQHHYSQNPAGFTRRPGSAGGLTQAGLGLAAMARTRSLTNPGVVAAALATPPSVAAAAVEPSGSHFIADEDQQCNQAAAAAAAAAAGEQWPVQLVLPVLPVSRVAGGQGGVVSGSGQEDGVCMLVAGSPTSISAAGAHPRSPKARTARSNGMHQQQPPSYTPALGVSTSLDTHHNNVHQHQQQQQQQQLSAADMQATGNSKGQLSVQPVRQPSLPVCGCCCASAGCRSSLPSAQPDMTEASTVARAANHLELEVLSTSTAGHNHAHFQVFLSHQPLSFATSLLLACALCIHSILEGLALGAQQSMQATEDIMLAIAAHKGLAAYALGASIVESGASDAKFWVVVGLFAAATPLGISIGYASSVLGHGPVSAAMSALASGTFLYVALNEVIPKELEHPDGHRLAKVAALLLGFGLMSLLAVWA